MKVTEEEISYVAIATKGMRKQIGDLLAEVMESSLGMEMEAAAAYVAFTIAESLYRSLSGVLEGEELARQIALMGYLVGVEVSNLSYLRSKTTTPEEFMTATSEQLQQEWEESWGDRY